MSRFAGIWGHAPPRAMVRRFKLVDASGLPLGDKPIGNEKGAPAIPERLIPFHLPSPMQAYASRSGRLRIVFRGLGMLHEHRRKVTGGDRARFFTFCQRRSSARRD